MTASLVFLWQLVAFGFRAPCILGARVAVGRHADVLAGMSNQSGVSESAGTSYTCCCKDVDEADVKTQCSEDEKTSIGGLRFSRPGVGKCCKKVDSRYGCTFYGGYSKFPTRGHCDTDERKLDKKMCCKVSSSTSFYVSGIQRYEVVEWDEHEQDNVPRYSGPLIKVESPGHVVGATLQGKQIGVEAVLKHLKEEILHHHSGSLFCKELYEDDKSCEIAKTVPEMCCCHTDDLFKADDCIPVVESPEPDRYFHAGAWWSHLHQTKTECAEWKECQGDGGKEMCCVRNEEVRHCKEGKFFYRRTVPPGQCRKADTLVRDTSFGQMRCPDREVPEGYEEDDGAECECEKCH